MTYPHQDNLSGRGASVAERAAESIYSMPAPIFYSLFPFHFILDMDCRLIQVQSAVAEGITQGL